jgi:hypothetical protein
MPKSDQNLALAIIFHDDKPLTDVLEKALKRLSLSWKVNRVKANPNTCKLLRRMRVPALMLYSTEGQEVSSAVGDIEIAELINLVTED